jgi:hypothetical protein
MILKPGARLISAVCTAELMTVKSPKTEVDVTIGGVATVASAAARDGSVSMIVGHDDGTLMGKRYVDEADTIELLCTKAGAGAVAVNGELLQLKEAKALPASD